MFPFQTLFAYPLIRWKSDYLVLDPTTELGAEWVCIVCMYCFWAPATLCVDALSRTRIPLIPPRKIEFSFFFSYKGQEVRFCWSVLCTSWDLWWVQRTNLALSSREDRGTLTTRLGCVRTQVEQDVGKLVPLSSLTVS